MQKKKKPNPNGRTRDKTVTKPNCAVQSPPPPSQNGERRKVTGIPGDASGPYTWHAGPRVNAWKFIHGPYPLPRHWRVGPPPPGPTKVTYPYRSNVWTGQVRFFFSFLLTLFGVFLLRGKSRKWEETRPTARSGRWRVLWLRGGALRIQSVSQWQWVSWISQFLQYYMCRISLWTPGTFYKLLPPGCGLWVWNCTSYEQLCSD